MVTMTTEAAPYEHPFYLQHDTPAGRRVAYPEPGTAGRTIGFYGRSEGRWVGLASWGSEIPAEARAGFIVLEEEVVGLRRYQTKSGGYGDWHKRTEAPRSDLVRAVWAGAPDVPTDAVRDTLENGDDDDETGWDMVYVREPLPRVEFTLDYDVSQAIPLPGQIDPAPNRSWTLADKSVTAVYGPAVGHLFPGFLDGFYNAVAERVTERAAELGLSGFKIYTHERGKLIVYYNVMWDVPKQRPKTKQDRGRGPFYTRSATTERREIPVPNTLRGTSKAQALEVWNDVVDEWVAKFLPVEGAITACSACDGRGFHFPKA